VESPDAGQGSAGARFTFAPTAKERDDSCERRCAAQSVQVIAANRIGAALRYDNQFGPWVHT
jgi:hypothetical protein